MATGLDQALDEIVRDKPVSVPLFFTFHRSSAMQRRFIYVHLPCFLYVEVARARGLAWSTISSVY